MIYYMSRLMYSKIVPKLTAQEIQNAKTKLLEGNKEIIEYNAIKTKKKELVPVSRENAIEKAVCMYLNRDYGFSNQITKISIYEN